MTMHRDIENITRIGVSTKLGEIRNDILKCGNELEKRIHGRIGGLVSDLLKELEAHTCRIAFIGQVKAGKSSLINALIQKPNFLPTDVNPSTAVVTKLIFGSQSHAKDTALFHFFTEEEWDNLVTQGPPSRERSHMFSLPTARQKLNELQKRAEVRLGKDFNRLLGKHHLVSAVTPGLLQKYVSAGDMAPSQNAASGTIYSDLTRMAEVFLDSEQYTYPSVVIDTPGVNDLFFIRDEITFANLADADVYVIVLTAHQPLSTGDLSLLRLLRGLHKDKIIAVINRVDGLNDPAKEAGELEAFVRQTLKRECPQAVIPVVSVSALWATMALSLTEGASQFALTEGFRGYAEKLGFGTRLRERNTEKNPFFGPEDRQMLVECSGVPQVIRCISALIANAVTEGQLLPCASTLAAIAHNAATSSRYGLQALSPNKIRAGGYAEDFRAKAYNSFKQIEALIANIDKFLNDALSSIEKIIADEIRAIENYVYRSIDDFAESQSRAYFGGSAANVVLFFSQEALIFRSELADAFARYYNDILKLLSDKQRQAESGLRNMIKVMLPALDNVVQFGMSARKSGSSPIVSLGKATSLESQEFWDWFASSEIEKGQEHLKRLIALEFFRILREVIEFSRSDLRLVASDGIRRLRLLALSAVFPVAEQIEMSVRLYQARTSDAQDSEKAAQAAKDFDERTHQVIARYESLSAQFTELKKRCFLVPA